MQCTVHLDLSRCPLLHKKFATVLRIRTYMVVIQPKSSGCVMLGSGCHGFGWVELELGVVSMS